MALLSASVSQGASCPSSPKEAAGLPPVRRLRRALRSLFLKSLGFVVRIIGQRTDEMPGTVHRTFRRGASLAVLSRHDQYWRLTWSA